ncbi:MAG TPA: FAD-dependent oxidoreductase [Usitatibacter sp.]|jgi:alanine dehydrogenase|nr:FAD-dependent oxidoreductase [Usitatibacter sp.]
MIVGVPREVKPGEQRVALLPEAVRAIVEEGHDVQVETRAGLTVGFDDEAYRDAGAMVVAPRDAWDADLVVKVKEMQDEDMPFAQPGCAVFAFHHLLGAPRRTRAMARQSLGAIAFEAVRDASGRFPMLAPMSRIAGRMAPALAHDQLGRPPARVLVIGAGHAGHAAAEAAAKMGAHVTVLRRASATPQAVEEEALQADLVVGAVFTAGAPTPKLLPRALVRRMKRGAMIVDICIEEGGVAETSRPTTHASPTYVEEGVIHYCVGNMPAAWPREASAAISEAALPYVLDLGREGMEAAIGANADLRHGVLLWKGRVVDRAIAQEAGLPYTSLSDAIAA